MELWREADIPVQLGFMRRFDPGYVRAKALIDNGELGRIEQFRALSRDTFPPPVEYLLSCGGSFLDMSVHDLDLARFLVGEVEEVHAWASVLFDDRFAQANDWDTSLTVLSSATARWACSRPPGTRRGATTSGPRWPGPRRRSSSTAPRRRRPRSSRNFGWEGDLYESFPDLFEVAYRRELEVFFENLGPAGR